MEPKDWLLVAIGDQIQPIQLQKAMFKFSKESSIPVGEAYEFEPYNWGPCSFTIYDDLKQMREDGLVEAIPSGRGWSFYKQTSKGYNRAQEIKGEANSESIERLDAIQRMGDESRFRIIAERSLHSVSSLRYEIFVSINPGCRCARINNYYRRSQI